MPINDNYDKEIDNISAKLEKLDQEEKENRINKIMSEFDAGILILEGLSENELLFLHSKLHFFWSFKNAPISKEKITEYHDGIITKLKLHIPFDTLDDVKN